MEYGRQGALELSHWFCKNFNVFSWSTEILLWLNFQSWKHPVKLSWQMPILQKICRGRSSLLCFDIFSSLPTARAWDCLRDILVCSREMSTSAVSTYNTHHDVPQLQLWPMQSSSVGRHLLLQVLVVTFCIRLWTLEPGLQEIILSIGANKELLPWLERVRSYGEDINFWCEWDFLDSLLLPSPQELSKQIFPEDLAKALTKDVQSVLFPLGSRNHNVRMCPSDLTKSYP